MEVTRLMVEIDASGAVVGATTVDRNLNMIEKRAKTATGSIGGFNRSLGGLARAAKLALNPLTGLLSIVSATMVFRDATRTISSFEYQLAQLQGITRASADEMAALSARARELGATTRFTAAQAGEGLEYLALAGFNANQAIAALPATLNLAIVGGISLGESADYASNMLGQFGLKASETGRIVDTLTVTSQSSNTSVLQLAEAMKFAGTIAGAANIDIETASAAIGVLGDRGIQGAMAGTTFRQMILTLIKPTKQARDTIAALGLTMEELDPRTNNMITIFERLRDANFDLEDATRVFSSRVASGAITIAESIDKFKQLEEANYDASGAAQKFSDTLNDTLKGSVLGLRSAIEDLYLQIGDGGLLGGLRGITDYATNVVRALGGMDVEVEGMNDTIDFMIAVVQELGRSAIEVINAILDGIQTLWSGLKSGADSIIGIFKQTGEAIDSNIGEPLRWLLSFSKDVVNSIIAIFETLAGTIARIGKAQVTALQGFSAAANQALKGNFDQARSFASEAANVLTTQVEFAVSSIPERLQKAFEADRVGSVISAGEDYASAFVEGLDNILAGDFVFLDRVAANFEKRQLERSGRAAAAEVARLAREAAEAAEGPTTRPLIDDILEEDNRLRENFVTNSSVLKALENEINLIGLSNDARERAIQLSELQAEAEEFFGMALAENDPIIVQFMDRLREIQKIRELKEVFLDIRDAASDAFMSFVTGAKNAKEALSDFLTTIGTQLLQRGIMQLLDMFIFGSGGGAGGAFGFFSSLISGRRQGGGPVTGGNAYMVGENGPEIFRPASNGMISPNTNIPQGGSSSSNPVNLTLVNSLDPDFVRSSLNDPRSQETIINIIGSNSQRIRSVLGV